MRKKLVFILLLVSVLAILSPYNFANGPNKCDMAFARCEADIDWSSFTLVLQLGYCEWGWAFCMKYLPKY
jgi:hypothetical protein